METKPTVASPTIDLPIKSQEKAGFLDLLQHILDVILLKTGSRISRGEYILAVVMLNTVPTLGRRIIQADLGIILQLLAFIWSLILMVKRLQDLER
jgi:hypothetical protein